MHDHSNPINQPEPDIPVSVHRSKKKKSYHPSQLRNIIQNLYFLPRLKSRKTEIGTSGTSKSITESTAPTRARLTLNCEIQFVKVIRLQLQHIQIFIRFRATLCILCLQSVGESAAAVFAGSASSPGFGLAFWCYSLSVNRIIIE